MLDLSEQMAWKLALIKSAAGALRRMLLLLLGFKRAASYVTARLMCIWCDRAALSAGQ